MKESKRHITLVNTQKERYELKESSGYPSLENKSDQYKCDVEHQ